MLSLCQKSVREGILVNSPFVRWTKVSTTLGNHATLEYHLDCLTRADSFKCASEDPRSSIHGQFNKELVDRIAKNRLIMEHIVRAILYLGKQGLAFRGTGEYPERGSNPGNFLSLLHLMAENDELLRNLLHAPEKRMQLTFPRRVRMRLSISSGRTSYRTDF